MRPIARLRAFVAVGLLSLAAIAMECGFFDQSHFSRVFTRIENRR